MTVIILRVTIECGEYLENLNLKNTQRDLILHIVFVISYLIINLKYIFIDVKFLLFGEKKDFCQKRKECCIPFH